MTLPAFWKGVLLSFIGAVVIPLAQAAYRMVTAMSINWSALEWQAAGLFLLFLIGVLTGMVHSPVNGQFTPASRLARGPPSSNK